MKNLLLLIFTAITVSIQAQNVGIGTTTPNTTAMLDVSSTNKGLLPPRMTTTQRNAIPNPANGLMVYDLTTNSYWYYKQNQWQQIGTGFNADSTLQYGGSNANTYLLNNNSSSDSSGILYDSGGATGNYGNNEDFTFYINPGSFDKVGVKIKILSNNIELPYDSLWIESYNFFTNSNDKTNLQGIASGTTYFFSTEASIIVRFKSNNLVPAPGFAIRWDFIYPNALDSTAAPLTGWHFVPSKLAMHGGSNLINGWHKDSVGLGSFSYGRNNKVLGNYASALGILNNANGLFSFSAGANNKSLDYSSISLGSNTTASGSSSTAMGNNTIASGFGSTAMGNSTTASSPGSTAMGISTTASGYGSTAMVYNTKAKNDYSLVIGKYNDTTAINSLFEIGNGNYGSHNNAMTVLDNGNVGIGTIAPSQKLEVAGNTKTTNLQVTNGAATGKILTSDATGNATWQTPVVQTNYWTANGANISNNNTGNVGIGIANATELLQTANSIKIGANSILQLQGDRVIKFGDGDFVTIGERVGDDQMHIKGNQGISFRTAGDLEKMTITGAGDIGIGTTNPTSKLEVLGSTKTSYLQVTYGANTGKVLTSDAAGNATWQTPSWTAIGNDISNTNTTGNVGIGTTSPSAYGHGGTNRLLEIKNPATAANSQAHLILSSGATNIGSLGSVSFVAPNASFNEKRLALVSSNLNASSGDLRFWTNNNGILSEKFVIQGDGNATLTGTLTQNSDARLKTNVNRLQNPLQQLQQLNGYTYNWLDKNRDNTLQTGLLAQEVQKVYPNLVKQDDKGTLSVNYMGLIPILLEGMKEQQKQIEELKKMITELIKK